MNQIFATVAEAALYLVSKVYTIRDPQNPQNTTAHEESQTPLSASLEVKTPHHVGWKCGCDEIHNNIPR
jgi:hypothetical protein